MLDYIECIKNKKLERKLYVTSHFVSRFQHNKIYTYIGEVLVSVNPYKNLDIYGPQHMAQYRGRELFEVQPHVYAIADACQRVLRQQVSMALFPADSFQPLH